MGRDWARADQLDEVFWEMSDNSSEQTKTHVVQFLLDPGWWECELDVYPKCRLKTDGDRDACVEINEPNFTISPDMLGSFKGKCEHLVYNSSLTSKNGE